MASALGAGLCRKTVRFSGFLTLAEAAATEASRPGQPGAAVPISSTQIRNLDSRGGCLYVSGGLCGGYVVVGFVQAFGECVEHNRGCENGCGEQQVSGDGVAEEQ